MVHVGERPCGGHFAETETGDADGQEVAGAGGETPGEDVSSGTHRLCSVVRLCLVRMGSASHVMAACTHSCHKLICAFLFVCVGPRCTTGLIS